MASFNHESCFQRWGRRRAYAGWLWAGVLCGSLAAGMMSARGAAEPAVAVAVFNCDVTPPLGHPLCGGWIRPLVAVDEPLLAKGVVLSDGRSRYVMCALDWCLLQTGAYDLVRQRLARALDIPESHVAVQTVHQHNAPIADVNAQLLLDRAPDAPLHLDLKFMESVAARIAAAAQAAGQQLRTVTHVGYGQGRVERFASNRRVRLADGRIHPRFSATQDAALQAAPEGLVDPWLRTVTLFAGDQPLVRLHYYASHPQSYYGDGRATYDTVGLARERLEREEGVPQVYFTGCAGNITAGKYNDGSPPLRRELAARIYQGMKQAIAATQRAPVGALEWKTAEARFELRTEPEWLEPAVERRLADTNAPPATRSQAALTLAWIHRAKARPTLELSRLRLGPVNVLHLPGEAFVEYQLYAQSLCPTGFVAVAAYGEGGPGYICTDGSLGEGGYEPTESRVGPPTEFRLKAAIAGLLEPRPALPWPPPYADKAHLLVYRDARGLEHPITRPADWAKRRGQILASMELVMGMLPPDPRDLPLDPRVVSEERLPKFTRQKITFLVEPDDRLPAYLLIPAGLKGKAPAMLCLHQTTSIGKAEPAGLGGRDNLHYAQELAERGYVTLAPDYPNFGDYKLDVYARGYASATMKGIVDHRRAVDLLRSLPQVAPDRIGVLGHSLGGHNSLFVASFDPRLKVVVTSCGFTSAFDYYGGDLTGWSHGGYMPRVANVYGKEPRRVPFDFTEILAAMAPRPVFVNAPVHDANFDLAGVKSCVLAAEPVYRLLGAAGRLEVRHPDCEHDFPPEIRQAAYAWLDRWLK